MKPLRELTNEQISALDDDEIFELVAIDIEAYQRGGPNRKAEHLALARSEEMAEEIETLWDEAGPPPGPEPEPDPALRPPETSVASNVSGEPKSTFVRRIGGKAPKEDFKSMLAGAVSKLHQLSPDAVDQLIKQGEADPEINGEEEETAATAKPKSNLPALVPAQQPATWDDAILAMNEQHAIIESVGGKTVIASWEPSPTNLKRLMVVFQTKDSFLLRYSNRSVLIEARDRNGNARFDRVPLGQWWLAHHERLQFRGVIFQPGSPKVVSRHLNLWQGWGVEPEPGDWRLIRQHIEEVIAGGNPEFADYVIRWIAWAIQNPAAQAEVALVLIGFKGAGNATLR